jgi:hypothetical protein
MKQITCPHCGDTYPEFDVAHVCSRGPYAVKLKPQMNERIKNFYDQVGIDFENFQRVTVTKGDMEKFAELIVEDTLKLLKQEWYDLNNIPLVEGENTRDVRIMVGRKSEIIVLMDKISKHFGVE